MGQIAQEIYIQIYTYIHIHIQTYTYTYGHIHTYTYIDIHIHTDTHEPENSEIQIGTQQLAQRQFYCNDGQ